jgi:hypothetical protein
MLVLLQLTLAVLSSSTIDASVLVMLVVVMLIGASNASNASGASNAPYSNATVVMLYLVGILCKAL